MATNQKLSHVGNVKNPNMFTHTQMLGFYPLIGERHFKASKRACFGAQVNMMLM